MKLKKEVREQTLMFFGDSSTGNVYYGIGIVADSLEIYARNTTEYTARSIGIPIIDKWYHVAGVFASATSKVLYVNGDSVAGISTSIALASGVDRVSVGRRGDNTDSHYSQKIAIAEMALFKSALSEKQISILAHPNYAMTFRTLDSLESDIFRRADTTQFYGGTQISTIWRNDSMIITYTGLDTTAVFDSLLAKLDTAAVAGGCARMA